MKLMPRACDSCDVQDEEAAMRAPAYQQAQAHAASVKRFTGGGFAIN